MAATYEARADEQVRAVELSTYATVKQGTGEDWKDARLVLSAAVPTRTRRRSCALLKV